MTANVLQLPTERTRGACPPWCDQHTNGVEPYLGGRQVLRHSVVVGRVDDAADPIGDVPLVDLNAYDELFDGVFVSRDDPPVIGLGNWELTPSQARALAQHLTQAADMLEAG
jgi:hypothetical protein